MRATGVGGLPRMLLLVGAAAAHLVATFTLGVLGSSSLPVSWTTATFFKGTVVEDAAAKV